MVKGKHGWLKIVEAFVAIMLIMTTALIVINREYVEERDISENVYEAEIKILEDVVEKYKNADDKEGYVITNLPEDINSRTPNYLDCQGQVCNVSKCESPEEIPDDKEDIYVQSMIILNKDEDKELKLFCWLK